MTEGMTQGEIFGLVVFILTLTGAASGVWWRIEGKIKEAKTETQVAVGVATAQANHALQQLGDFRVHVAENYTSKHNLASFRDEIMTAISGVKSSVDHMNARVDRVIESDRRHGGHAD